MCGVIWQVVERGRVGGSGCTVAIKCPPPSPTWIPIAPELPRDSPCSSLTSGRSAREGSRGSRRLSLPAASCACQPPLA